MGQGHRAGAGAGEEPRHAAPSVPPPRRRGGADQRRRAPRQGWRCSQEGIRVHGCHYGRPIERRGEEAEMSGDQNDAEATGPEDGGGQYANQNHGLTSLMV
uniref:Uncharacterized protein n=1 Tax=Oryza brachyantha TaxID=4533 RepID=J3KZW0_ORYBR